MILNLKQSNVDRKQRHNFSKSKTLTDAFFYFKKNHPESNITLKQYLTFCKRLIKKIVDEVLNGELVNLPHGLGYLWIKKYKTNLNKPPIDFYETKKQGKTVYHLNFETNGWSAKWNWSRRKKQITNLCFYCFLPIRVNSRRLCKEMRENNGHYKYLASDL